MGEVVRAINLLSQRNWIDYITLLAPLVLSVVAIGMSISTARKQNKIALFEKRYEIYNLFLEVFEFSKSIKNMKTTFDILLKWTTIKKCNHKIKERIFFYPESILDMQDPEWLDSQLDEDNIIHDCVVLKYCLDKEISHLNRAIYVFPKNLRYPIKDIIEQYELLINELIDEHGSKRNENKISKFKTSFILSVNNFKNDKGIQVQLKNCLIL